MLVPLILKSWPQSKKNTIRRKMQALAGAQGQDLRQARDIPNLTDDEPLWLYSHGGDATFAGATAKELAKFLQRAMPQGPRVVVLKGCRTSTKGYDKEVQEILNRYEGYEDVQVVGFEGEASQTAEDGTMTVRLGGEKERRDAARQAALEQIRAARQGGSRETPDEREYRTHPAVYDPGLGQYVANTPRQQRLDERRQRAQHQTPYDRS